MDSKYLWLVYVILAGLAWGTYVPIIFFGGSELGARSNARLMAILCVGVAYFVIGVMFPLTMFLTGREPWPEMKSTGLVFSSLAGVAGAVGAICVVFASQAARQAAVDEGYTSQADLARYRIYIAPLIFGLAPIINVLVSSFWHPRSDNAFHFTFALPGWQLWVGIVLIGAGAGLVLYSKEAKELDEAAHAAKAKAAAAKMGVTLEITGITNDGERDKVLQALKGLADTPAASHSLTSTQTGTKLTVQLSPVSDVPAFVTKIGFGKVTEVKETHRDDRIREVTTILRQI